MLQFRKAQDKSSKSFVGQNCLMTTMCPVRPGSMYMPAWVTTLGVWVCGEPDPGQCLCWHCHFCYMLRYWHPLETLNLPKASLSSLRKETQVQTPSHRHLFSGVCKIQDWRCQLPGAAAAFLVPSLPRPAVPEKRVALALCPWRWVLPWHNFHFVDHVAEGQTLDIR